MTIALLDGDSFVYRGGFAAEKTYYVVVKDPTPEWIYPSVEKVEDYRAGMKYVKENGGVLYNRKEIEPLENCLQIVKTSIQNTLKVLKADDYRLYLSGRRNFRDDIYGDYKANRDSATRPKYFRDIRDYLLGQWQGVVCDGIEADDALGIDGISLGDRAVIVAQDKDLDQIPGRHYNWTTGEAYQVSAREGLTFFYEQLLSGDPTDNIPGIEGIGPVKAHKALVDCKSPQDMAKLVWSRYYEAFRDQCPDDSALRELIERNASLLWIQRKKDDRHPFWKHYGA